MDLKAYLVDEIIDASLGLYESGYYRESMINSILCLFDMIREESGLQEDGAALIGKAFSVDNPRIILADLQTESGRNIQKGIIQILQGYYQAYRNVGSHSLKNTFQERDALSLLISISCLYEKILNSEKSIFLRYDGLYFYEADIGHQYLRFYEDGFVISVSTIASGEHKDILNWFNRENAEDFRHFSKGNYELNERTLDFYTESSEGRVNCSAVIRSNLLHVESKSLINGNESNSDYTFISWSDMKV